MVEWGQEGVERGGFLAAAWGGATAAAGSAPLEGLEAVGRVEALRDLGPGAA